MKKTISFIGAAVGVILLILSFVTKIPDRELSFFLTKEYVGGDAYNFLIEASILGGEISAAKISRAIYLTGGSILTFYSLQSLLECENKQAFKKEIEQDQKQDNAIPENKLNNDDMKTNE